MRYRVMYHRGDEVAARTEFDSGFLYLTEDGFRVVTHNATEERFSTLHRVELFRLVGLGRMIRVDLDSGRLFLTVIRFNVGKLFALVNYFGTGDLCQKLNERISTSKAVAPAEGLNKSTEASTWV